MKEVCKYAFLYLIRYNAKAPTPGTLKTGRIKGSRKTPMAFTTPIPMRSSERMKKGNKDGKITFHHKLIPEIAASKVIFGLVIIEMVMKIRPSANK